VKLLLAIKALSVPGGGAERVFVDLANGLSARGHEVGVLTFEAASAESFYPLDAKIPRADTGLAGNSKLAQILSLPVARRVVMAQKPDAVVAFMPSCYVPLGAALIGSGIPVVASEHNVPARYAKQPMSWMSMRLAGRYAAAFTAVSEQMRRQYPRALRDKMTVLPNPLSVDIGSRANVAGHADGRGRVIAVGRLHEQKDHLTLVRAFSVLAGEFPGWTLRILGEGNQRGQLERAIAELGLGGRVELPGTVRDIAGEYRDAQLYVIPSRYESYGLATVEALAHGLPAIGFADCPGTNELIRDGINGLIVDPRDDRTGQLVAAMRRLMMDKDLRQALASRANADALARTLPQVLDEWEAFLARTVAP